MRRVAVITVVVLAGCGGGNAVKGSSPSAPKRIALRSSAFRDGGKLPRRFTCDGPGISPPLRFSGVSRRAKELALLLEDPDAPGGTFVHWVVLGVPASARSFAQGRVPAGAVEAKQSFGNTGYGAPCPPKGDQAHRYVFSVYALSRPLHLGVTTSPADARSAIGRAALARGVLTAKYGR